LPHVRRKPGHIHRGAGKGGAAHTVFRAGEVHGRITQRAEEICRLVGYAAELSRLARRLAG
jgi:2-dehydropantoate 2-reductase